MEISQPHDPSSFDGEKPTPPSRPEETYRHVAAAHIATLSEINHQLPKMLRYFATALTQLTDRPIRDAPSSHPPATDSLESRREAFRKYATFAGYSVNLIREELVRQIEDLEKHKVIPASHPKFIVPKRHGDITRETVDPQANVKNGGYGEFDVGVLNARASAGVAAGEDVLERARLVLEELMKRSEDREVDKSGDEECQAMGS